MNKENKTDTFSLKPKDVSKEKLLSIKEDIQKIKSSQNSNTDFKTEDTNQSQSISPDEDLMHIMVSQINSELTSLVSDWELNLSKQHKTSEIPPELPPHNPKSSSQHLEIMGLFYKIEKDVKKFDDEMEVVLGTEKENLDDEKILPLFELLDKELTSKKKKVNIKDTFSDTKSLDRSELLEEFEKYNQELLKRKAKTKSNTGKQKNKKKKKTSINKNDPSEIQLVLPSFAKVLLSFLIDLIFVSTISLTYLYNYHYDLYGLIKEFLHSFNPQMAIDITIPIASTFFISWFSYVFLSTVLYDTTLGMKIFDISICNKDGSSPSFSALFKRIFMQILSFLSLGIRPMLIARKKNGFYCNVSKTQLAYTYSIPHEDEEYFI